MGLRIEYTHYQNKKEKEKNYDSKYSYQKYDSVTTYLKNYLPSKTIFFDEGQKKEIDYSISSKQIKIQTDINNFKIHPDDISFNLISHFIFSNCSNNIFIINPKISEKHNNVGISINFNNQGAINYLYKLIQRDNGSFVYEEDL